MNARKGRTGKIEDRIIKTKSNVYRLTVVGEAAFQLSAIIKLHILSDWKKSLEKMLLRLIGSRGFEPLTDCSRFSCNYYGFQLRNS